MKLPKSFALNLLDSKMRHFFAKESNKWNEKGPWRFPSVFYTLEHKLAFLEREHYLTGHYSLRGIFHDWEKPFLYITPWIRNEKKIQETIEASKENFLLAEAEKTLTYRSFLYIQFKLIQKNSGKKIATFVAIGLVVLSICTTIFGLYVSKDQDSFNFSSI